VTYYYNSINQNFLILVFLGTFITLDICIFRLEDTKLVNIKETVEKIRSQRAYSIQMPDQYVFCYNAVYDYIVSQGLIRETSALKVTK
jgi:hypothetical protein